ncbi:MAG: NTP transferase domain-containing protein [Arthrobacter sp.]|uniref:molybdenum cofactor guanylyltransferase n=1 Tax=Arthrobacter sp. TaxID=1667 RepID=UPI0034829AFD
MRYDAVVVAGGRGSRLGGEAKPLLVHAGRTLLGHALAAVSGAVRIAVVGPTGLARAVADHGAEADPGQLLLLTREEPAFGGPAAAVAAGLHALHDAALADARAGSEPPVPPLTVVLAADLLDPAPAVRGVLEAAEGGYDAGSAWVPLDAAGRLQPLSCAVATAALREAVAAGEAAPGGLADSSMMRLLARVQIVRLSLDGVSFDDVDTWDDAGRAGISRPSRE